MNRKLFALSFGFVALLYATQHALAQTPPAQAQCGARAQVVAQLAATYGETRQSMGLAANSAVMEVYASEATGTWTIAVTLPSGVTCLIASGEGYEALAEKLPAKGEDA